MKNITRVADDPVPMAVQTGAGVACFCTIVIVKVEGVIGWRFYHVLSVRAARPKET